jgi:type 1 glutamine amidotransferase
MTAIANGCIPDFTLMSPPARLKRINAELEERAAWLVEAGPVPYVGLVFSERSQQLCEKMQWKDGPCFTQYGALRALLEEKVPETCLSDYNLEHDDLSRHAVIVLPDTGIISPTAAERLREFVRHGGGLVAGCRTSLCDPNGEEQADFDLADLFGVHFRGRMPEETNLTAWTEVMQTGMQSPNRIKAKLLRCARHPIVADPLIRETKTVEVVPEFRRGWPADFALAYPGEMLRVEAAAGTEVVLWEDFQEPGVCHPFLTARKVGKGRVVYVAANLGFQYASHYSWAYVRRLIANSVRWAAGRQPPPFRVESLLQVQATLFRQSDPNRLVLHLLNAPDPQGYPPFTRQTWYNHFTSFGRQREDIAPVVDIRVQLRGEFSKVRLVPGGKVLQSRFDRGYTDVVVPRLDTHAMVVAERGTR